MKNRKKGGESMEQSMYLTVKEVASLLGISDSYAYKIMRQLNKELEQKGMIIISGKVNRRYFMERLDYGSAYEKETERRD